MSSRAMLLFRFIGIPLVGLLFWALSFLTTPPEYIALEYTYSLPIQIAFEIPFSMLFALLISEGCIRIYHRLDALLPWETQTAWRLAVQASAQILYSVAAIWLFMLFFEAVYLYWFHINLSALASAEAYTNLFNQTIFEGTLVSLLIGTIYTGSVFFERWKTSLLNAKRLELEAEQFKLEAERFKLKALQAQLNALKQQLDPHFLFNTLNTLTTLIAENQTQAIEFVERLSQVYRYVLQSKARESIDLRAELEFARAYSFLMKVRFGDNLRVDFQVPERCDPCRVAPMTLQLLIENAMKHNIVSREKPLPICISVEARGETEWLVVSNPLQRKRSVEHSLQVGLKNLFSRYQHLTEVSPAIEETEIAFTVKLPLLQPMYD